MLDTALIDCVQQVCNDEALETARKMAPYEGIPAGISSGAAVAAAMRVASCPDMKGKTVVTLLPNAAERYLSTVLFDGYETD